MEKIKLILPNLNFKNEIEEYKKEFILNGDSMDGCAELGKIESFEEWIQILKDNSHISTVRGGFVPSSTTWL